MSEMYLVRFERNYADEYDVTGFIVVSPEEWALLRKWAKQPQRFSFGTNQQFEDVVFSDALKAKKITAEEGDRIRSLFGLKKRGEMYERAFGDFPNFLYDPDED